MSDTSQNQTLGTPKTVSIAGATGVVGRRALSYLLEQEEVDQVIAVGRRTLAEAHDKLLSRVADFQDVDSLTAALPENVDIALCTLGTTLKQAGSKEAFRAVDFDAVLHFAKAAQAKGAGHFVVVTAIGSDPNSRAFYSKTKGEAEEALKALGFERLTILRPSLIDDEGARKDNRRGEQIGLIVSRALFSVLGKTRRYAPIKADTIAKALVRLALDDTSEPVRVLESDALHRIGA